MVEPKRFDEYRKKLITMTEEVENHIKDLSEDKDLKKYIVSVPADSSDDTQATKETSSKSIEKSLKDISYSLSILKENVFPITLLAKFQSGKSTTMAAMADGREITPRGKGSGGLRTSTVCVTIYNDDNIQEVTVNGRIRTTPVTINLYTKQELVQFILDAAGNLENKNPDAYDLDKYNDRKILKEAIESEIDFYKVSAKDYPISKLAILREAILILAFYNCDARKKLHDKKFSTITGMQSFLKTDNKWETKWANLFKENFDFDSTAKQFNEEEILYVFIESIKVPIKSEFLKETGTSITDAPGIMANFRDTQRALKAANEAAIIVFIVNGSQQFTIDEINQLKKLHGAGLSDKIVFATNYKRNPDDLNDVEEHNLSTLEQIGFTAPHHKKFLHYNAFFALRAYQGEKIINGAFDELSKEALLKDVTKTKSGKDSNEVITVEEAWKETTMNALGAFNNLKLAIQVGNMSWAPNPANKENADKIFKQIRAISDWDKMVQKLRSIILENRASGILLDMGILPVIRALEEIEQILQDLENYTENKLENLEAEYGEAKEILDAFYKEAITVLNAKFTTAIDDALADDYYKHVIIGSVDEALEEAATKMYEITGVVSNIKSGAGYVVTKVGNAGRYLLDKITDSYHPRSHHVDIQTRCQNILAQHYREQVLIKGNAWMQNLEKKSVYDSYVRNTVIIVQNELQKIWKSLKPKDNPFLVNIEPVPKHLRGSISKDVELNKNNLMNMNTRSKAIHTVLSFIAFSIYAGTVGILVVLFLIPYVGQIVAIIAGIIMLLRFPLDLLKSKEEKIAEFKEKVSQDFCKKLNEDATRKDIKAKFIKGQSNEKPGIRLIREFYKHLFRYAIEQQEEVLEEKYKKAKALLRANEDELKAVQEKTKKWREVVTKLHEGAIKLKQDITKILSGETKDVELE